MTRQEKRDELSAVRRTFCTAVKYSKTARGDAEALEQALMAACAKLRGDLMAIPRDTVKVLNEVGAPEPAVRYGASFAEGAVIVTALADRWRARRAA